MYIRAHGGILEYMKVYRDMEDIVGFGFYEVERDRKGVGLWDFKIQDVRVWGRAEFRV